MRTADCPGDSSGVNSNLFTENTDHVLVEISDGLGAVLTTGSGFFLIIIFFFLLSKSYISLPSIDSSKLERTMLAQFAHSVACA